jgi:TM2 domain-containing membrane protein YozV
MPGLEATGAPELETASPKSYAAAVALSSCLGWVGIHHFYLGRWAEGILDVGLSVGWVVSFVSGEWLWGVLFLAADFGHALFATIWLLTGNCRDGEGRRVCFPGQKLRPRRIG